MRRYHLLRGMFLLVSLCSVCPASAEVVAWFVPSSIKVLRDAKPDANARQAELAAARNETEACQLVLRSAQAVTGVVVRVSEFRQTDGTATLPAKLYKVEYVPNVVGTTAYPDPLPPLGTFDLQADQAQPVWISVKVLQDAKPGTYRATVEVEAGGQRLSCPVQLRVWNFALPVTPSAVTAFGLNESFIAQQHGVGNGSPESRRLYGEYYEMLLGHRVSAYSIPVELMSDEAAKYLNDPRMTSYQIPFPADDDALKALVARLVKGGWYGKGYFYPIDEPVKKDAYQELTKIGQRLASCAPDYRWVVPFFCDPDWDPRMTAMDLMSNRVNVWCVATQYFDTQTKARPYLAARRDMGDSLWWYVCCNPGVPYNNFFVEMTAMSHRLLFWQQKREKVQGLLYWCTNYWNPNSTKDPWTDMATVKDINANIHGDGSLLYPGKQVGVNGPISSLRLEMIRDGLEDYEYLTLADAWLGPEAGQALLAKLVPDMTHFEQDPLVLEKARRELGEQLEKHAK